MEKINNDDNWIENDVFNTINFIIYILTYRPYKKQFNEFKERNYISDKLELQY